MKFRKLKYQLEDFVEELFELLNATARELRIWVHEAVIYDFARFKSSNSASINSSNEAVIYGLETENLTFLFKYTPTKFNQHLYFNFGKSFDSAISVCWISYFNTCWNLVKARFPPGASTFFSFWACSLACRDAKNEQSPSFRISFCLNFSSVKTVHFPLDVTQLAHGSI